MSLVCPVSLGCEFEVTQHKLDYRCGRCNGAHRNAQSSDLHPLLKTIAQCTNCESRGGATYPSSSFLPEPPRVQAVTYLAINAVSKSRGRTLVSKTSLFSESGPVPIRTRSYCTDPAAPLGAVVGDVECSHAQRRSYCPAASYLLTYLVPLLYWLTKPSEHQEVSGTLLSESGDRVNARMSGGTSRSATRRAAVAATCRRERTSS